MWLIVFWIILAVILWLIDRARMALFGGRKPSRTVDHEIARMEMHRRGPY